MKGYCSKTMVVVLEPWYFWIRQSVIYSYESVTVDFIYDSVVSLTNLSLAGSW